MKKFMCVVLCAAALLTLSACKEKNVTDGNAVNGNATDGNIYTTAYNGNDIVTIVMPLGMIPAEYQVDTDAYCEKNGFEACTIDFKTQTASLTMDKSKHKFFLADIGMTVIRNIASSFESEQYPYFKNLGEYNEDFSEITVLVDGKGYMADSTRSFLTYYVGECGLYYQNFTEKTEYICKVIVKDEASGEILDARSYAQDNTGKEPSEVKE